jgi:hypothetical protein
VGRFLASDFAAVAAALGGHALDLFGCDRDRPFAVTSGFEPSFPIGATLLSNSPISSQPGRRGLGQISGRAVLVGEQFVLLAPVQRQIEFRQVRRVAVSSAGCRPFGIASSDSRRRGQPAAGYSAA